MQENVRNHTERTQTTNDSKAHEVLWRVCRRKQIGAIYRSQVTHRINKSQADSSSFVRHRTKCAGSVAQAQGICSPKARSHDDEQDISSDEVVDCADDDRAQD